MSSHLSSDLLSRLKAKIEPLRDNPHGRFVTVSVNEMAALVQAVEAASQLRITVEYEDGCSCGQCESVQLLNAALSQMEAL
jgi:hypothetical protein